MNKMRYIVGMLLLVFISACTQQPSAAKESVQEMVTGRWASLDHQTIVLVDLKNQKFQMLQLTEFGLYPVLIAEGLKIVSESRNPEQIKISFDFNKKRTTLKLLIEHSEDDTYYLILVNTLTGKETPLDYVSDEVNIQSNK